MLFHLLPYFVAVISFYCADMRSMAQQLVSSTQTLAYPFCGNGRLDPGEDCDPLAPGYSSECCSSECRFVPPAYSCFGGSGVCQLGRCVSRSSDCAGLNNTGFQFSEPISGLFSVGGPWQICALPLLSNIINIDIDDLISSGGTTSVSIADRLLPPYLAAQTRCSKVCEGTPSGVTTGNARICVDTKAFSNYNSAVSDYLACVVDKTTQVSYHNFVDEKTEKRNYESILTPGICISGVCRSDICDATRCSGHGTCRLSQSAKLSIDNTLKISSKSLPYPPVDQSLVVCTCDPMWTGRHCDLPVFNETAYGACSPYVNSKVQEAVLTSVFSTAAGCIALFLMSLICIRAMTRRKTPEGDQALLAEYGKSENKRNSVFSNVEVIEDQTPIQNNYPPLKVPQIQKLESLKIGQEGVLCERKSSIRKNPPQTTDTNNLVSAETTTSTENDRGIFSTPPLVTEQSPETESATVHADYQNDPSSSSAPAQISVIPANESEKETEISPLPKGQNVLLPANYLRAAYAYNSRLADEIDLLPGDILYLIKAYDDGWAKAYNLRSGREGIFPLSFTKRIVVKDASESLTSFAKGGVFSGDNDTSFAEPNIENESKVEESPTSSDQ